MNTQRPGFTLAEVLVVTVLGAVVMSSIYQMVNIQERTTRHQHAVISTSDNAQAGLAVIANDLKEISARDGDVTAADSLSITFRALRQTGIVCDKDDAANSWVDVWELGGAFQGGDDIYVYEEGVNVDSPNDDQWLTMTIASVGAGACAANPLGVTNVRRINVGGGPFTNVTRGALVRSFLDTRYRLVDSGEWGQLLRTEEGTETPIIEQLATEAEGGLRLRYFDAAGAAIPLANLNARLRDIMRIQIKVAGKAVTSASANGDNRWRDSLVSQVYLRGNMKDQ
jgi:prepilin-type N-terminal cleavage/methylation domain-containing protein